MLTFDFCTEFSVEDSWRDLTNKGTVTLPKNIYVRNEFNKLVPLGTYFGAPVSNINIGGFSSGEPLLLRGDTISIEYGYKYFNRAGAEVVERYKVFEGFISKVTSKKPIEFEVEDNMWKLKQIPVPVHTFSKNETLEDILRFLIKGTGFTVNALTKTTFGAFTVGNETAAESLARLKKLFNFDSYFRENELRSGALVYIESEAKTQTFSFQQNIIDSELEYMRKDDVVLSAVARNTVEEETGKVTKDGQQKTRKARLEVLVTYRADGTVSKFVKTKDNVIPENTEGERREFFFPGAKNTDELATLAEQQLRKYYYTGYKGKFSTFGIPFVRQGDNAKILDPILPERNGTYKIKSVEHTGGVNGMRQIIELDYKIS